LVVQSPHILLSCSFLYSILFSTPMLQWSLQQMSSCLRLPTPKSANSSPRYCMDVRGQHTPWPHYPRPRVPDTSGIGDWLDVLEKLCPSRESKLGFVQPVTTLTELSRPVPMKQLPHCQCACPTILIVMTPCSLVHGHIFQKSLLRLSSRSSGMLSRVVGLQFPMFRRTAGPSFAVSHPGRPESSAVPLCEPETSHLFSTSTTNLASHVPTRLHDDITPKVTIVAKASFVKLLA